MMKLFVCLFLYLFVAGSQVQDPLESENESSRKLVRKKRILFGEVVNAGAGAFMGSLQRRADRAHLCGGSLITLRHLITTCSCVAHTDDSGSGLISAMPEGHIIIAGSISNWNLEAVNTRNVSRLEADYRCRYNLEAGIWEYDIGYITVTEAFAYADQLGIIKNLHNSQSDLDYDLALMMDDKEYQEGGKEFCYVFGWGAGKTSRENDVFDVSDLIADLRHKAVQFINELDCKTRICGINEAMCAIDLTANRAFCMVSAGNKEGPLCDGDNGTPLLCYNRIYAVGEVLFECGSGKASLFYELDIESLRFYILTGTSVVHTPSKLLLYLLPIFTMIPIPFYI